MTTELGLSKEFEQAAEDVKNLSSRPTDAEMLEMYSLYKQATIGDCNTDRPGMFDFKGKAKWDAWNGRKGLSRADAEKQYIAVTKRLMETYGAAK